MRAPSSPLQILDGVVRGVGVGGNCSGIPTPQGFCYFDNRYAGKPLVFAGTVGVMPRQHNGQNLYQKKAEPGDLIVMVGGRVGKDGIHGATFSSEPLDPASPVTAVQIGDPITQKKFSDVIVKEARDLGLYRSITDNGAGGLSCSVAEMAKECNGCHVELDRVPLKYPGMASWEIWISESQERMTLAVPPEKLAAFTGLLERREVEATVIGRFTDTGRCVVDYHGSTVMDIDLAFLHDGLPRKHLATVQVQKTYPGPDLPCPVRLDDTLISMLGRRNICSTEFVTIQYRPHRAGRPRARPCTGEGPGAGSRNAHQGGTRLEKRRRALAGALPRVLRDRPVPDGRGRHRHGDPGACRAGHFPRSDRAPRQFLLVLVR